MTKIRYSIFGKYQRKNIRHSIFGIYRTTNIRYSIFSKIPNDKHSSLNIRYRYTYRTTNIRYSIFSKYRTTDIRHWIFGIYRMCVAAFTLVVGISIRSCTRYSSRLIAPPTPSCSTIYCNKWSCRHFLLKRASRCWFAIENNGNYCSRRSVVASRCCCTPTVVAALLRAQNRFWLLCRCIDLADDWFRTCFDTARFHDWLRANLMNYDVDAPLISVLYAFAHK